MLNINNYPHSLKVIKCESPFTTDVLITCAIEIDSNQFNQLLTGYKFERDKTKSTSFKVVGPNLVKEFEVTDEFSVYPDTKKFKDGGSIQLFTNKQQNKAIIHYYVE